MPVRRRGLSAALAAAVLLGAACDTTAPAPTGQARLLLGSVPDPGPAEPPPVPSTATVDSLSVTITALHALPLGADSLDEDAWVHLDLAEPVGRINLMAIEIDTLARITAPVGDYLNIRLDYTGPAITFASDVEVDGTAYAAGRYPVTLRGNGRWINVTSGSLVLREGEAPDVVYMFFEPFNSVETLTEEAGGLVVSALFHARIEQRGPF